MQIKGAKTILKKRCEFYGKDLPWLFKKVDEGWDEPENVKRAVQVYRNNIKDQDYWLQSYGRDSW